VFQTTEREKETITFDVFLEMSADITYRLSGMAFDPRALLDIILHEHEPPCPEHILVQAITATRVGYGDRKRKLGPLAFLHPIRVASILTKVTRQPSTLDLLLCLLHDRDEDLTPERIGKSAKKMHRELDKLVPLLGDRAYEKLEEGIGHLTHYKDQLSYGEYLAALTQHGECRPEVLRVKLADRLDNTLDVGVGRHGIPGRGVFALIFDALFLPTYSGPHVPFRYVPLTTDEGIQLLANLFKNTEFISVLRAEGCAVEGPTARLMDALLLASRRIAGFLVQDSLAVGLDVPSHRGTIEDVREYCLSGGMGCVRSGGQHPLDGMFLERYGTSRGRRERLKAIFKDHYLLARLGLTFLGIFESYLADPDFYLQGITGNTEKKIKKGGCVPAPTA